MFYYGNLCLVYKLLVLLPTKIYLLPTPTQKASKSISISLPGKLFGFGFLYQKSISFLYGFNLMVDDVVAKRVWKFDSGLCKKIPVLNFSKKKWF